MGNEWNNNGYQNEEESGEQEYAFQTLNRRGRPKTLGWSLASLIMGIVAAATSVFGWSSLILGIAAIAFAIVSRKVLGYFDGKSMAGLILGIFGGVFGAVMIAYTFTIGEEENLYIWESIKQMFEEMENAGAGSGL